MIAVDTYGWLERFLSGPKAAIYNRVIEAEKSDEIVTSVVSAYEVYRKLKKLSGESAALEAVVHLRSNRMVPLDDQLALEAADFSLAHSLHFADAVVYATARRFGAVLHTSDPDLKSVPGVVFH
jgi:predicted nucleic acid-binding protein